MHPRLVRRENIAQALGGINPFDPVIGTFNEVKAELLLQWRFPPEEVDEKAQAEKVARHVRLHDEARYGEMVAPPPNPGDELVNQGFDFIQVDDD